MIFFHGCCAAVETFRCPKRQVQEFGRYGHSASSRSRRSRRYGFDDTSDRDRVKVDVEDWEMEEVGVVLLYGVLKRVD